VPEVPDEAVEVKPAPLCPECGAPAPPAELICPACNKLLHADTLKKVAAEAQLAEEKNDLTAALTLWRQALDFLPRETRQHETISARIVELSERLTAQREKPGSAAPDGNSGKFGRWGVLGTAVVFLLSKGKFLLLGLSKASTIFSMLAAIGVYWALWGWQFALGFVLGIYVHEMGHVAALRHYGIPATAPMFIPGIGAFVRIKQYPATPSEDAYVGLAGPLWGLGAACIMYVLYLATNNIFFAALTHITALINVFNLTPFGSLDGGRGFRALSRPQRFIAAAAVGATWYFTHEGFLLLVLLCAAGRWMMRDAPKKNDNSALAKYIFLIVALMALSFKTDGLTRAALSQRNTPAAGATTEPEEPESE
jgi:Zn-dependent protease